MNNIQKKKEFIIKGKVVPGFRKDGKYISLIRYVADIYNLKLAYLSIKSRPSNMTPGAFKETFDGINEKYFFNISEELLNGTFQFSVSRKIRIPKKKKGKHSLVIPSPRDKIVLRVVADVLEAIYNPEFSPNSHGFRVNRGYHSALKQVSQQFGGVTWVIKCELTNFFGKINHEILLNKLRVYINDEPFINLIQKYLQMKYGTDKNRFSKVRHLGVPQEPTLSSILSNIYLNDFDIFIESLKKKFYKGKQRRKNPEYRKVLYELTKAISFLDKEKLHKEKRKFYSKDWIDPNFRRLYYVRYADTFLIGIAGTLKEVKQINIEVQEKLGNEKLTVNDGKFEITHLVTKKVTFLETFIQRRIPREKPIRNHKKVTPLLSIHAPIKELFSKLKDDGFFRYKNYRNTPRKQGESNVLTARNLGRLVNISHEDILRYYNIVVRSILDYYSFVDNHKSLGSIVHGLKHSCALTLALKFKLRHRSKVFKKFGKRLGSKNADGEVTVCFNLPTTFKRTRTFLIKEPKRVEEVLAKKWNIKFTESAIGKKCAVCQSSVSIEIHHMKRIKDLKKKAKFNFFKAQISAIKRKQVPLCKEHHHKLHSNSFSELEKELFAKGVYSYGQVIKKDKFNKFDVL